MAYNKTLFAATARGALVLALVCSLASVALGKTPAGASAERPPIATSLRAITSGEMTLIEISGTAPMPFTVRKPDARQIVVELPGVDSTQLSHIGSGPRPFSPPGTSTEEPYYVITNQ